MNYVVNCGEIVLFDADLFDLITGDGSSSDNSFVFDLFNFNPGSLLDSTDVTLDSDVFVSDACIFISTDGELASGLIWSNDGAVVDEIGACSCNFCCS